MLNNFIKNVTNSGVIKLGITADDLVKVMKDVARETANSLFAKMEEERSSKFISRKEAMQMSNVATAPTMIRWEEKGYLSPLSINDQIYYEQDEVIAAIENIQRQEE